MPVTGEQWSSVIGLSASIVVGIGGGLYLSRRIPPFDSDKIIARLKRVQAEKAAAKAAKVAAKSAAKAAKRLRRQSGCGTPRDG